MPTFTQASLASLAGTTGKRLVVHDPKLPGLRAELREGGALTFFVYRWSPTEQKPIRLKIGTFPELTVDAARKLAQPHITAIMGGENPARKLRAKRGEADLKELFLSWLETHGKLHKKRWREDQRIFNVYLAPLHGHKLSTITNAEVAALHAKLGKSNGKYQANRALALLRSLFNKAHKVGFEGANPASRVEMFKEQSRDRFLQPHELPRFFEALKGEPNETLRDFFLLCLFTGARRGNVQAMRWADVDIPQALWRIPETKAGKPQFVNLVEPAVQILVRRLKDSKSEYVLPGRHHGKHLKDPMKAWKGILQRAELENVRIHDLRRTLGSYLAITGTSLHIVGAALGHSDPNATKVYARLTKNSVAEGLTKAVAMIESTGKRGGDE